jgi:hypothetical protein
LILANPVPMSAFENEVHPTSAFHGKAELIRGGEGAVPVGHSRQKA